MLLLSIRYITVYGDGDDNPISFLGYLFNVSQWHDYQSQLDSTFSDGQWKSAIEQPQFTPPYTQPCIFEHPFIMKYIHSQCYRSNYHYGKYFIWNAHKIRMNTWDAKKMCRVMNGRKILFLGDSLQSEFFYTFMSYAFASTVTKPNPIPPEFSPFISQFTPGMVNESTASSAFDRCDKLCEWNTPNWKAGCDMLVPIDCGSNYPSYYAAYVRSNELEDLDAKQYAHWLDLISLYDISVVFLNAGAHYQEDSVLFPRLSRVLSAIYTIRPEMSVFFRNTPMGHADCGQAMHNSPTSTKYLTYPTEQEACTTETDREGLDSARNLTYLPCLRSLGVKYQWHRFYHQNLLVRNYLRVNFPSVVYIDVATSTNLRPDSHVGADDCLHYCMPGPIDNWVEQHYHALVSLPIPENGINSSSSVEGERKAMEEEEVSIRNDFHPALLQTLLELQDGTIVYNKDQPDIKFLYYNGTKRWIADPSSSLIAMLCSNLTGSGAAIVKPIDPRLLHRIPTRRW